MDGLNKAYTQIVELFRTMTPAARITTALLLAVVVISLVFLLRQHTGVADDLLFGGQEFSQAELDAMEAAFAKKGLNDWEVSGRRIRVPRRQRNLYIAAVDEQRALPQTPATAWDRMFLNDNPLTSKQTRELAATRAHEQALALMIKEMAGVDIVRVQIQEIETGEFPRRKERRALVSVKATGNIPMSAKQIESIRNMVVSGGGVDTQNTTIADLNTGQAYPGSGEGGALGDNLYAKHQREFEDYYRSKILDRLSTYGEVKVAVSVELDTEMVNQTVSDKYDPKSTPIELTDYSKEVTSSRPETGGRPGVVPNASIGNVAQQVSSAAGAESSTTERRENQKSVAGTTRTVTEKAPFVPTWMGVSVAIPRSYFQRVWKQRNPPQAGAEDRPPSPAELSTVEKQIVEDIEAAVMPLLPKVAQGEDPYPRVAVMPYDEAPLPLPEGPGLAENALTWLGSNWQTIGLLLVAAFSLVMLRGMIRSAPDAGLAPAEALSPPVAAERGEAGEAEEAEELANSLRARLHVPGRSLRDELTELVQDDPDAAAGVLQSWIGEAA